MLKHRCFCLNESLKEFFFDQCPINVRDNGLVKERGVMGKEGSKAGRYSGGGVNQVRKSELRSLH